MPSGYSRRIGLLGGSFNPAHGAHRAISLFVKDALALDEIWWLVSPGNPLKPAEGMAPLSARFASARHAARRAPIRVTAIERQLNTRYTIDTLREITSRYPRQRFVWIMGADNLQQFVQWKNWRGIARIMPIAVIARPGYDGMAQNQKAMSWLRRFVRSADQASNWMNWRTPALVPLRFRPDPRSATLLRQAHPLWHREYSTRHERDMVTHHDLKL